MNAVYGGLPPNKELVIEKMEPDPYHSSRQRTLTGLLGRMDFEYVRTRTAITAGYRGTAVAAQRHHEPDQDTQ